MEKLKENDLKLLGFCEDVERSVNDISQFLNIKPSSVSQKIQILEEKGLIIIDKKGWGKKTLVRTKTGIKTKEYFITLLKEIKKRGGVTTEEYSTLLPADPNDPKEWDKIRATLSLRWITPKLIDSKIFITAEGKKFLKENSK